MVAGHQGHAGLFHQLLGFGLQAHGLDGRCGRANEHQPRSGAGVGKFFVLAQKTVAGVDGLGAGGLGRSNDALPLQVAVFGGAAANVHGLIARGHMLGVGIGIGIHGDGLHPQAAGGGGHAAGDFTAISDQDFFKHHGLKTFSVFGL